MTRTLRALPTLLKIGIAEAIAYRAEMLVWVLSTTMPFVMWVMWSAVAQVSPVVGQSGRAYGSAAFSAYFLCTFMVRQIVASWASWEMNFEVRQGTLAMRLLRPIHPVISYAMGHLAALPLRFAVATPVAVALVLTAAAELPHDPRIWALWVPCMVGAWLVAFFSNIAVGTLCFFMESSLKVMEVWLACLMVFSGYLIPLDLFPPALRVVAELLPFRYQIGLPVEVMTGRYAFAEAARLVAIQWAWAAGLIVLSFALWRTGVKRFQAYGG
ncbi:MAG: ABC-2 family transporter protein [Archangiaceae bacterium]|nr:ABC-2 family transporter protein [Archangiaceae bacterium]